MSCMEPIPPDAIATYLAALYPESFDPAVPKDLVYSGNKTLTENVVGTPLNVGQLILSPTRTYAPVVKALLAELRFEIHGMVHCSGGAQTKVLHFVDDVHIVKDNLFEVPPLFDLIQSQSNTDYREMYQVFNMGHRLEVYLPAAHAQTVINCAKSFRINAQIVGYVDGHQGKKLTIKSPFGEFEYS